MFYVRLLTFLGLGTLFIVFSGFPIVVKDVFHVIFAVIILIVGWMRYQVIKEKQEARLRMTKNFEESHPEQ